MEGIKFTMSKEETKVLRKLVLFYGKDAFGGKKKGFNPTRSQRCTLKILEKFDLVFMTDDNKELWLPTTYGIGFLKGDVRWFLEIRTDGEMVNPGWISDVK